MSVCLFLQVGLSIGLKDWNFAVFFFAHQVLLPPDKRLYIQLIKIQSKNYIYLTQFKRLPRFQDPQQLNQATNVTKPISAQVRNLGYGGRTCLDSPARKSDLYKPVGLYPCHRQGGNQVRPRLPYSVPAPFCRLPRQTGSCAQIALVNPRTCTNQLGFGPVTGRGAIR